MLDTSYTHSVWLNSARPVGPGGPREVVPMPEKEETLDDILGLE